MTTLIAFLFALALLIFVHELGHYSVARWCGVKVLRFSIGFGKPLLMWRVGPDRTEWTISAIPLGGYVKMLDEREDVPGGVPAAELHRAFNRQSLGKRSAIVVAGPAANFLLAIALYMVLNMAGLQEPAAVLSAPPQGTPAAAAAVQAGDRVVSVDGRSVRSFTEMRMRLIEGVVDRRTIALEVERGGARIALPLDAAVLAPNEIERDFTRALGLELASGAVVVSSVMSDGSAAAAGLR
ncbi:MAG TPA: RIP metalloprotease RseP, partial [Burkholderiaceae bacterium]|nr:RIP metalloprotease RseP [Burkholderiaceae bacterium]